MFGFTEAEKNDIVRQMGIDLTLRLSPSVQRSSDQDVILEVVQNYIFPEDSPVPDHSFAVFEVNGISYYFFLIDPGLVLAIGRVDAIS